MTKDQARQLDAVLFAAETWLIQIAWERANEGDPVSRGIARSALVDEIDELMSAIELDEHGGLGRGGRT